MVVTGGMVNLAAANMCSPLDLCEMVIMVIQSGLDLLW